jgi:DNA-binding NtrC family response regulator
MMHRSVVLVGNLPLEMAALNGLVQEFGWSLETAGDLTQLRNLLAVRNPVAIFLDANGLGLSWQVAVNSVLDIDSQALLILCHRFSDAVDWPKLAEAGAFHALALPFDQNEVRQSLAFVWSARVRRTDNILPMRRVQATAQGTQAREEVPSVHGPTLAVAAGTAAR